MGNDEWRERAKPRGFRLRTYGRRYGGRSTPVRGRPMLGPAGPASTRTPLVGSDDDGDVSPDHALLPRLQIGSGDYLELGDLTAKYRTPNPSPAIRFLERELARAVVVDDRRLPSDVATLRSQIAFHDEETGRGWVVTIGHPADFLSREDAISVLSPLGAALIGLSEGQSIEFQTADGRSRRVRLVRVLFQPTRCAWNRASGPGP